MNSAISNLLNWWALLSAFERAPEVEGFCMSMRIGGLLQALLLSLPASLAAQSVAGPPIGTWEGESVCQVPKPCTTEHVVYEIREGPAGQLTLAADKVVNGERLPMGELPCTWAAAEKKLSCPMENVRIPGDWIFVLSGDTLTGAATTRADHRLFRKINVQRRKQQ